MKRFIASLIFFAFVPVIHAQGWLDYKLEIGDGYAIWRNNSMDISVANSTDTLLIGPGENDAIGPVVEYSTTERFIFTKNLGKKPRNLFTADTLQEVDIAQEFYFILIKGPDTVIGPLTQQEFESRPEVQSISPIKWKSPENPNFWLPVLGTLYFLLLVIPFLVIKYFWITIPTVAVICFMIRRQRKKRLSK